MSVAKQKTRWYLFPFAFLYGFIVSVRNRLFDFKILQSCEFEIPIISVGNISTGGTGKTPHVEYLIKILKEEFGICVLSRGYKRKTKKMVIAEDNSTVFDIGDEPKQIKQKFKDICVIVHKNRKDAINKIIEDENNNSNVIILDDAYQHRKVKPGLSILLIDYNRPITKDYLLPVGNLRERAWRKNRAHFIIVTKTPENIKPIERRIMEKELNIFPYQSMFFTTFKYGRFLPVFENGGNNIDISKDTHILVFTGVAVPRQLLNHLSSMTNKISHLQFADHHNYKEKDINKILNTFNSIDASNKIIVTTEKDAMRIQDCKFAGKLRNLPLFFITIEVEFLDKANKEFFNKTIINYVRTNKKHSRLYK